ncbi:pyridoxamine 5'-phosphate oxidase [Salsuginibacillus halophilus]|uniref:Pyridoxamine 5'-phosphate oxidase n=1 Tax=Salsuginibacillus halophilus TaxID=517424 RepID=A0A2P8HX85_9BACI|nr:pyridoxamine 5'-phosphate oxidase family protein [Salsuginibacillus halophilus]PSL50836.1 pyridoxamine 5'-phosphate oxidase [Salsuginibacillus halophilus]
MVNRVDTKLKDDLLKMLKNEQFVTLATVHHETGSPDMNSISWVYAPDEKTIRFAVDRRSRSVENIKQKPEATLNIIGSGSSYAVFGQAEVKVDVIEGPPLKLALIELTVNEVKDIMFYGARVTKSVAYEKTYDEEAAAKLDRQVMTALQTVNDQS